MENVFPSAKEIQPHPSARPQITKNYSESFRSAWNKVCGEGWDWCFGVWVWFGVLFFFWRCPDLSTFLSGGGAASSRNGFPSRREEDAPLPRQRRRAPPGGAAVLRGRERHGGLRGGAARAAEAEGQRWGSGGRQAVRGRRGKRLGGTEGRGDSGVGSGDRPLPAGRRRRRRTRPRSWSRS